MTQILVNDYDFNNGKYTKSISHFSTDDSFYVPYNKDTMLELEKSSVSTVGTPVTGNLPVGFIFPQEYKIQEYIKKHGKIAQEYFFVGKTKMMEKCDDTKMKIRGINDVYCKILEVTDESKDSVFRDLIVEIYKNNEQYVGSVTYQLREKMVINELEILPYDDYEPDLIDLVHRFEKITDERLFSYLAKKIKDGYLKDYIEKINCKISDNVMTDPVRFPSSCYPGAVDNIKQQEYVVDRSTAESISKNTVQHPDSREPFQIDQLEPANDIKELIEFCRFLGYA